MLGASTGNSERGAPKFAIPFALNSKQDPVYGDHRVGGVDDENTIVRFTKPFLFGRKNFTEFYVSLSLFYLTRKCVYLTAILFPTNYERRQVETKNKLIKIHHLVYKLINKR